MTAKRILIVEDEKAIRDMVAFGLRRAGYEAVSYTHLSGLSQQKFADVLGVSARTLQDWEQGRRKPTGAARSLLAIAAKRPDVLREVLAA